uniref:CARD domain-containing protein n=1 Tax=Lates calcarifer TaxID=8187 RepID=A0A4W6FSL6_LATCA
MKNLRKNFPSVILNKARLVVDTVRRKGEAASSEMIELLCELDPFLCEHLELM